MGKDTTNLREVIGRALESAGWLNCDPEDWAELCNSLATKDAEIAELRRQLGVLDRALTGQAELRRSAEACLRDQQDAAIKLLAQRDEARECVKRLYSDFTKIRNDCVGCMKDMCDTYLAATPEHLR